MRTLLMSATAIVGIVCFALPAAVPAAAQERAVTPDGEIVPGGEFVQVIRRGRPVLVTPEGRGVLVFGGDSDVVLERDGGGTRSAGTWAVRDQLYCMNYAGQVQGCYKVYRTAPNSYTLWTEDNRRYGVITIEE